MAMTTRARDTFTSPDGSPIDGRAVEVGELVWNVAVGYEDNFAITGGRSVITDPDALGLGQTVTVADLPDEYRASVLVGIASGPTRGRGDLSFGVGPSGAATFGLTWQLVNSFIVVDVTIGYSGSYLGGVRVTDPGVDPFAPFVMSLGYKRSTGQVTASIDGVVIGTPQETAVPQDRRPSFDHPAAEVAVGGNSRDGRVSPAVPYPVTLDDFTITYGSAEATLGGWVLGRVAV